MILRGTLVGFFRSAPDSLPQALAPAPSSPSTRTTGFSGTPSIWRLTRLQISGSAWRSPMASKTLSSLPAARGFSTIICTRSPMIPRREQRPIILTARSSRAVGPRSSHPPQPHPPCGELSPALRPVRPTSTCSNWPSWTARAHPLPSTTQLLK